MRRNLLCFVTGAVVTLAVVLLVRSGQDAPQPSAASAPSPAAVTTAAREPAPNVKLRGHHVSPHGHHAPPASSTARAAPSGSTAATPGHAAATPSRRSSHPSSAGDTPTVPADTVPDDTAPPAGTGTTLAPSDDPSGSSAATTTPQTDSAVTIPNQATPDGSVGTP